MRPSWWIRLDAAGRPYPRELAQVVADSTYRPDWTLTLWWRPGHDDALTLTVTARGPDAEHARVKNGYFAHQLEVPADDRDRAGWVGWLFDQLLLVERHEAMEWFRVAGARAFPPAHGEDVDPYAMRQVPV